MDFLQVSTTNLSHTLHHLNVNEGIENLEYMQENLDGKGIVITTFKERFMKKWYKKVLEGSSRQNFVFS